jgi:hypothetical protein
MYKISSHGLEDVRDFFAVVNILVFLVGKKFQRSLFVLYKLVWHVDTLLGNDRKIRNYVTAFAKYWLCKQQPLLGCDSVAITWATKQTGTQQLRCNRNRVFYAARAEMV